MVWIGVEADGKGEGRVPGVVDVMIEHDEQFVNPSLQICGTSVFMPEERSNKLLVRSFDRSCSLLPVCGAM